ncbi:alpha-L-fucosidase [Paenibacillus ferrarius]|uniref:Alpha-L-fucosidase n=1 Tax=Paenibacillus ferrarius TaxID=1469647 RepID=A0A1V4HLU6_9BACL|nr:glycoside hydrolase family 95 protein [Paenibacillus ferrarius]OPH58450.1 alpha-L-fucosidase [Paenibacillus ferrarius]
MNDWKLWYTRSAKDWSQGLPLGNGRLGAVVYGGSEQEVWRLSEVTFWSGQSEPIEGDFNSKADLEEMRQHFFAGDYQRGEEQAKRLLQPKKQNFGTNLPMCHLILHTSHQGQDFHRELDLETAILQISYQSNGITYRRETFASHADDLIVSHLWGEQQGSLSFTLGVEGLTERFTRETASGDSLIIKAHATETMHSNGECGVHSYGIFKVVAYGGTVSMNGGQIEVTDADEAFIYVTVNTDYRKSDAQWLHESDRQLEQAMAQGYAQLKANHLSDYKQLYDRVSIDLGHSEASLLPTDERIRLFRKDQVDDPQLYALFYQYGRYLMIAGSRANSPLPLNLQGIWNDGEANRMQWSCDYHLDINTQMNYFPTEASNLAECHLPLVSYIEQLAAAGRRSAQQFYGCEGWVAHVFSNAWGFTAPGWETSWGLNVTGGLWIAAQIREHYEYSLDQEFLLNRAYPVMKEAAAFFLDYMTVHPAFGWLVTGPSNSPENSFYIHGHEHQLSMGPTLDQVLVRDLFVFCLEASKRLGVDLAWQEKLNKAIAKLPPLQIGKQGQLQEWLEDYEEAQPDHRHLSHLVSLFPSHQVTVQDTPALSEAARTTLRNRMSRKELEDVEFTVAAFAASFSRLQDGENAYKHLTHLIGELCFDNLLTYSKPGIAGAEKQIFVVDGNFGGTAAIADMLLQCRLGQITLLPALPLSWSTGKVTGLRAKGHIEVDITWENGELSDAWIKAYSSGRTILFYGNQSLALELKPGAVYKLNNKLQITEQK